jgi:FkbM family methyltransferase
MKLGWARRELFGWSQKHWSQFGEDVLLGNFFESQSNGFFIDVGAHHPERFSNTYALYRKGWSGINIDPRPGVKKDFKRRPRDITLEIGIGKVKQNLTYFEFNEPACNTFDPTTAKERNGKNNQKIVGKKKIPVMPLQDVIDQYAQGRTIDLLSVDVEGMDLEVLSTINFKKNAPLNILVEVHGFEMKSLNTNRMSVWLLKKGYTPIAWVGPTVFWKKA